MTVIPGVGAAITIAELLANAHALIPTLTGIAEQHPDLLAVRSEIIGNLALMRPTAAGVVDYVGWVSLFSGEAELFLDGPPDEDDAVRVPRPG